MGRVVHFEIHAENPQRAVKFYTEVFGWSSEKWDGPVDYWLLMTGDQDSDTEGKQNDGIDGAVLQRVEPGVGDNPINAFVCTISVDNLDNSISKVMNAGGKMALQKREIPGVGWNCYCKDSEGNIFGMLQPSPIDT